MSQFSKGSYFKKSNHRPSMNIHLSSPNHPEEDDSIPLGTFLEGIIPQAPKEADFIYDLSDTLHFLEPLEKLLQAPEVPGISPPPGRYFPSPPVDGYKLVKLQQYTRGFAYIADYDLSTLDTHKSHLLHVETPPLTLLHDKVILPGMIKMTPGIPFAFRFDQDPERIHTVACLHTLESLEHYPDFNEIIDASVQLAELSWGYSDDSNDYPPVFELDGLKPNDRSTTRPFQDDTRDGSYSLGHTVMEGDGFGTVLPSVQANSSEAFARISTILKVLHTLRRLIMPKCISLFENTIWEFHMNLNNVFSFGGLEPNGSSVQLNVSSLGVNLSKAIGAIQGFWHVDFKDDPQWWTLFILLLRIGPDGDPGPFLLARGGIYIHELDTWIVFIAFKGTDMHTGTAPHEDAARHAEWVANTFDCSWNLAGPQNRLGYVIYLGGVPSRRMGSANITPPTGFGNYGSNAAYKATQKDFASHGHMTMGTPEDRANRLGREAVSDFYNTLRHCQLSLNIDINELMQNISFHDRMQNVNVPLRPLPYHPIRDKQHIKNYLSLYSWHLNESNRFNLGITNKALRMTASTNVLASPIPIQGAVELSPASDSAPISIQEVLNKHIVSGQPMFAVRIEGDSQIYNIALDHPCVLRSNVVQTWVMHQVSNRHSEIPRTLRTRATGPLLTNLLVAPSSEPYIIAENIGEPTNTMQSHTPAINTSPRPASPPAAFSASAVVDALESGDSETTIRPRRTTRNKRKFAAISNDDHSGNHNGRNDNESRMSIDSDSDLQDSFDHSSAINGTSYEVEAIIGHRNMSDPKNREWLVKFVGYEDPEYVPEDNLSGCLQLLSEYNQRHGLQNLHLPRSVVPHVSPQGILAPRTNAVSELAANLHQLLILLDERRLESEIASMITRFQNALNGGKAHFSNNATLSSLATTWIDHNNAAYNVSDCLTFFQSSPLDTAMIRFTAMYKSVSILPKVSSVLHQLDALERGFQQDLCRALISIYEWCSTSGPLLADKLLSVYQETNGFAQIEAKSPAFACLVDHVVQHTYARIQEHRRKTPTARRPRLGKKARNSFDNLPNVLFHQSLAPDSLHVVPSDLYGLITLEKPRKPVKLPVVSFGKLAIAADPMDALVDASNKCLQDLWMREVVYPAIKPLESHSALSSRSSSNMNILFDRVITRGAILSCVQDVCQSDGIFASNEMKMFLSRPSQDLLPIGQRESQRAKKLIGPDRDEYLDPIRDAIADHLERHPRVVEQAMCLGNLMTAHLYALHTGGTVDYDDFLPFFGEDVDDADPTRQVPRSAGLMPQFSRSNWAVSPDAKARLTADLLPTPVLTPLALILREALNKRRNLGPGDEIMRRILDGSHPSQSSTRAFPPSHTDPIWQSSEYARLFNRHLPGFCLTARSGISSLLSWMGTGQGYGTKDFLDRITRPRGFLSTTLEDQLEVFRPAMSANHSLSLHLPATGNIKMHLIPGYIACFDERIWGQPNNLFNICPVIRSRLKAPVPTGQKPRLSIEEKFAPYWCAATQDRWAELLGPMIDQDPETWDGQRPTWFEVMDFLQSLHIPLFGRGLTVLQTANNLVFAKIATMPSQAEVSGWIFKHKSLGAYRGLHLLGFSRYSSYAGVRFAFNALYDHLDRFLSDSDKQELGFNPLFLEHVLCKVARWSSRLQSSRANGDVPTLHALSERLQNTLPTWNSGDNATDPRAIPFPLLISEERLVEIRSSL